MRRDTQHHGLHAHHHNKPRRHMLWGATLVVIGTAFLLDRLAVLDLTQYLGPQARWWHYLPLLVALGGVITVASAQSVRHVLKGLGDIVLGLWVFACLEQMWGLTFANSWPILLVAFGMQMLLRGWFGSRRIAPSEVAQ